MFTTSAVKGTRNYLDTQKKYEIIRTVLYFAISLSLFFAGHFQLGVDKAAIEGMEEGVKGVNLLEIVAVLGCLPASKSAVGAIMFLRFKSCSANAAKTIEQHSQGLRCLYDMVFTSYKINFAVSHLAVCGNTVCGYTEDGKFGENEFYKHIDDILKLDGHKDVTVKIFTNLSKYTERLEQMKALGAEEAETQAILDTLKSVAL